MAFSVSLNRRRTMTSLLGDTLSIAQLVSCTEAEGPGKRFAIWFQGCPLRCVGCCNPEMLTFDGGSPMTVADVVQRVDAAALADGIEGITLLGGEPFAHAPQAAVLGQAVRERGLSVMVFSGYLYEDLCRRDDSDVRALLRVTDLLVDGPYDRTRPDTLRRWIGSTNQRVHFLSDRYEPGDPCWNEPDTLEIRLEGDEVSINGFPAQRARGLWKRL